MPCLSFLAFSDRRRTLFSIVAVCAAALLAGCEQDYDDTPVAAAATSASAASGVSSNTGPSGSTGATGSATASITVAATTATALGAPLTVPAVAKDAAGNVIGSPSIAWTVADQTIATVDAKGTVTPLRAGFTTVSATSNGVTASTILSVRGAVALPTRSKYIGMNLAGIAYWTTQFPFVDIMKDSSTWSSRNDSGAWGNPITALTKDGYPASLASGQHALTQVAWGGTNYPVGSYTVLWDGDGDLSFPLSGVKISSTQAHRIVIDVTDNSNQMWVGIDRTNAADPVHNIHFLLPGAESTYATQPFNVEFLKKVAPFSNLRFMDWGATNASPIVEWADRAHVDDASYGTAKGVPIEVMIDLANTLHVDPWFCIPHMASDDYVKQFATLVHGRLDPALHAHMEYSNEVWNFGFAQTTWANAQSDKLGLAKPWGTPSVFYAQRAVAMFKIIRQVYGADSARIVRVIGGQAAWTQFQESALGYADTAANADVLAVAPYFNAASAADATKVATTLTLTSDQIVDQMLVSIRGDIKNWIQSNAALASKYNLTLKAYESGPGDLSYYFPADKQDAMTALFASAHRNPRMKAVYDEYFALWIGAGGDTMNQFNDIGGWSKWGLWSSLEYVTQDPMTSPKYQGLLDAIAKHPTPP